MTMNWPHRTIQEHHDVQPDMNIVQYLGNEAMKSGLQVPTEVVGIVKAELHRGLWIARCPNQFNPNQYLRCSNAVGVTSVNPVAMCPVCGGGWWRVEFPRNRAAIERELMKRPIPTKGLIHVNWSPFAGVNAKGKPTDRAETLSQLRRETLDLLAEYEAVA